MSRTTILCTVLGNRPRPVLSAVAVLLAVMLPTLASAQGKKSNSSHGSNFGSSGSNGSNGSNMFKSHGGSSSHNHSSNHQSGNFSVNNLLQGLGKEIAHGQGHHPQHGGHGSPSKHCSPHGHCYPSGPIYTRPYPYPCDTTIVVTQPQPTVIVEGQPGLSVPRNQLPGGAPGRKPLILIMNRPENMADISYLVGDQPMTTPAGQVQELPLSSVVVTYDRGENFGEGRNSLTAGTYEFRITEQGWQIFRKAFEATLANPGVVEEFRFMLDGKVMTLPAGRAISLKGEYPIAVTFDQGNGAQPVTRPLFDGTFVLRFDAAQALLDIAPEQPQDPAQAAQANQPFGPPPGNNSPNPNEQFNGNGFANKLPLPPQGFVPNANEPANNPLP